MSVHSHGGTLLSLALLADIKVCGRSLKCWGIGEGGVEPMVWIMAAFVAVGFLPHISKLHLLFCCLVFEFTLVCKCQYLFRASLMDEENCCKLAWRNPYNYPWMNKVNTEQHQTSISVLAGACSARMYGTRPKTSLLKTESVLCSEQFQ